MRQHRFGKALTALALLLTAETLLAQGYSGSRWNETSVGLSIVVPDGSKGLGLAIERHQTGGGNLFVDGSAYVGALLLLGGIRGRLGDGSPVSPFAHVQAGGLLTFLESAPLVSAGVGVDFGGTRIPRTRVQVDALVLRGGGRGVRVSVGLLRAH
jgi:hypothetical protein